MAAPSADLIWMDGDFIPWQDAQVHVMTHTLHYGLGVFEGIRAYETEGGVAIFRLEEHLQRLEDSARLCEIEVPYSRQQLSEACQESIRRNRLGSCYLRPLIYHAEGGVGLGAINPVRVTIAAFPWGAYLGKDGLEHGIKATVSSFTRQHLGSNLLRAKMCGQYTTSILAKRLARRQGYEEAIFLDSRGYCCEGSGENLFILSDGVLKTPPTSAPILPGITRDSVVQLARSLASDLGIEVREELFARDELLLADEAFFTGTAAEVTPIREIDGHRIGAGDRGPVTEKLQSTYFDVVQGRNPQYSHWLTGVSQLSVSG